MTVQTRHSEIESTLQAFVAAGGDRGVFYLSTPITTGRRELELMAQLGIVSREELRHHHSGEWLNKVVRPNKRDAVLQADLVTETIALGKLVINPARITHADWSQSDYDNLWTRLIQEFPVLIVPVPGWEYSRGSRLEVQLACALGIPVVDIDGTPFANEYLAQLARSADIEISANGWGGPDTQLPPFDPAASTPLVASRRMQLRSTPDEAFAREIFSWLVRERNYQLGKFGTALDDKHTLDDGLTPQGWWDRQLAMYFHRARILGLEQMNGRQALAKYVATACGMLESVVRLYGRLPSPGVPSGEIRNELAQEVSKG